MSVLEEMHEYLVKRPLQIEKNLRETNVKTFHNDLANLHEIKKVIESKEA